MRWSVICLLLVGCHFGDSPLTEEEFCQQYARRECDRVAMFCATTGDACQRVRAQACRDVSARSKTNGRQYTPANTDRCLEKVTDTYRSLPISSTNLTLLADVCGRVFQGIKRAGDDCVADPECTGNLICDKGRCGVPKVVSSLGGCANIGEECPRGEYCALSRALYMCVRRQDKGAACSVDVPCIEKFQCSGGACMDLLNDGTDCTVDTQCSSGYCNPYGSRRCAAGLSFSPDSPSCLAYMGALTSQDAGAAADGPRD